MKHFPDVTFWYVLVYLSTAVAVAATHVPAVGRWMRHRPPELLELKQRLVSGSYAPSRGQLVGVSMLVGYFSLSTLCAVTRAVAHAHAHAHAHAPTPPRRRAH